MSKGICEPGPNGWRGTKRKDRSRKKAEKFVCLAATCLVFCLVSTSMSIVVPVSASPTVSLSIDKRLGFGMFSDISGTFTLVARVSSDVIRVEFYLDDQLKLNDTSPPFQWDFDTTEYSLGLHTFEAIAHNGAGESANASTTDNFVESPMPPYYAAFLVLTIGSVVLLILIFSVIPFLRRTGRGNSSTSMTRFVHTEL